MVGGLQEHSGNALWALGALRGCLLGCRSTLGVLLGLQEHSGNVWWAECLLGCRGTLGMLGGLQEHSGNVWWVAGALWECLVGCRGTLGVLVGLQGHSGNAYWGCKGNLRVLGSRGTLGVLWLQGHSGSACWVAGAPWECLLGCRSTLGVLVGLQ